MALTDVQIRAAKAKAAAYRLPDGGGLHLRVAPTGAKSWQFRYRWEGKEQTLTLGPYPAVSLAAARAGREAAKAALRAGQNPTVAHIRAPVAHTFESVARDWHRRNEARWVPHHAADVLHSLETHAFPTLGAEPIADITPPAVLALLREIEARQAFEVARKLRQRMSAVFVFAIASGLAATDPAGIVKGAMASAPKRHQPAVLELPEARKVLAAAEAIPAFPITKLALRFLALTAVRPGEVRGALWEEFRDLNGPEPLWVIPAERMKMKRDHVVPLARQAVEVLETVRPFSGRGDLVFPNSRHAHEVMSENAMGYLLNRAGYHGKQCAHGWRATFSTIMNERNPDDRLVIDLMLAHLAHGETEGAYNRAAHRQRRRELAQEWADLLLEGLSATAELVNGRRR